MHDPNDMWSIAELAASQVAAPQWGHVLSYNSVDHTAKVQLANGPPTDELPIALMGGMRYAPTNGQMAFLTPESQDSQALVISGFAFNDLTPPPTTQNTINGAPTALQQGEWEAIGPSGSSVRLNLDGSIFMLSGTGLNIQANITADGNILLTGKMNSTGTITSQTDVIAPNGSLNTVITDHNEHSHIITTLGGPSGPPSAPYIVQSVNTAPSS